MGNGSLGGTNLDGENLITVQTCVCAVVRTLKKGSDKGKGKQLTVAQEKRLTKFCRLSEKNKNTSSANSETYFSLKLRNIAKSKP